DACSPEQVRVLIPVDAHRVSILEHLLVAVCADPHQGHAIARSDFPSAHCDVSGRSSPVRHERAFDPEDLLDGRWYQCRVVAQASLKRGRAGEVTHYNPEGCRHASYLTDRPVPKDARELPIRDWLIVHAHLHQSRCDVVWR